MAKKKKAPDESALSVDDLIDKMAEKIRGMDGEEIADLYNEHFAEEGKDVEYDGDSIFSMLRCTRNSPEVESEIKDAFGQYDVDNTHPKADTFYEHGQWHVQCNECGAQWSVNDSETVSGEAGFEFEELTMGDEEAPCFKREEDEDEQD